MPSPASTSFWLTVLAACLANGAPLGWSLVSAQRHKLAKLWAV